jgi:hypothetical protein
MGGCVGKKGGSSKADEVFEIPKYNDKQYNLFPISEKEEESGSDSSSSSRDAGETRPLFTDSPEPEARTAKTTQIKKEIYSGQISARENERVETSYTNSVASS